MKKLFPLIIAFIWSTQLSAQNYWDTFSGSPMNSTVKTIVADTGDSFYVGGYFTEIGNDSIAGIAYWNGSYYTTIGKPGLSNAQVLSMVKFNGGLVAGGTFDFIDTTPCNNVAFWDGSEWSPLGSGLEYTGATTVSTLAVYEDTLYAAGNFSFSGSDSVHNIAKWTGENWEPLGLGVNGTVNSMYVFDGELYVAGSFLEAGGLTTKNIARWDGHDWDYAGDGLEYTGATTVSTLQVFNDNLYAGGSYIQDDTTFGFIAKWDGSEWSEVGDGLKYTGATTVSTITMCVYDTKLIVEAKYAIGGNNDSIIYAMQMWNDTTWEVINAQTDQAVYALTMVDKTLYAGGDFTVIDDLTTSFIARWEEGSRRFIPYENTEGFHTIRCSVYPNPVKNELHIKTENSDSISNFKFVLTDLMGRQILEIENVSERINFERQSIHSGLYLYKIIYGNTIVQQGKLLFD
jgi:trimeric autotransporter adhesin